LVWGFDRTFCKWLNSKLETKGIPPMTSLASDLSDGVRLIQVSRERIYSVWRDERLGKAMKKLWGREGGRGREGAGGEC